MQKKLQAVCNQLIEESDLIIRNDVADELFGSDLTLQICEQAECEIKIYSRKRIPISDIIPILGDFGFITISEITYEAMLEKSVVFITKLTLDSDKEGLLVKNRVSIKDVLLRVLNGEIERGKLLGLVYLENFSAREILLSRAFGNYAQQIMPDFNKSSLEDCIIRYHDLFALFLHFILVKFDPEMKNRDKKLAVIEKDTLSLFKEIENINDDRILKLIYEILQALVRTNYFAHTDTLSLKFDVSTLMHILKGVQPHFETFVYAHDMQGTHLRVSKVCRGGIRWSNRTEDFRTEVKSLMTTQEAKNSIIVPKGAKGGFVIKKADVSKEEFEGYYTRFINALLDVVDNQKDGEIVRDTKAVIYDGDDPYFVVAADKGTSSMSDRANEIAMSRGFWLHDAFASGSSNGYHHKKLGVTAKGAIKASQRFFIEKGVDFYKEPISIIGVGSMSGDVFGNGLIESEQFKLIGAISSDEIFIDPNPDVKISYAERKRLFALKRGKWSLYDKKMISKGGGVFKRASKSITLTPEIKVLLHTEKATLSGEELAKEILKLKVDMLYFGGIGTYVKSSTESNISLGDKENEFVRIDADEIGAKVVCEGANLALTMSARIEYALNGGKINLDSIDNSAGVDTSDHEVNLKILLNALVQKNLLCEEGKNSTLVGISDIVVGSVMWTNYMQSLSISLDSLRSLKDMDAFKSSLTVLEKNLTTFKRSYFNIPRERDFHEVIDREGRLIRPIIATMTLYAKILLQDLLCGCSMYEEDSFFDRYLFKYFPKSLIAIYEEEIRLHPLKKEIISMIIANKIINNVGATFIKDLDLLGREKFLLKIKAYLATNQLYDANDIRYEIYRSDYEIEVSSQYKMLLKIEDEIAYNVQWMLKSLKKEEIDFGSILEYKTSIKDVITELNVPSHIIISGHEQINEFFTNLNFLKFSSTIIKIKQLSKADFKEVSMLFYALVQKFEIPLLMETIENISPKNEVQEHLRVQIKQLLEFKLVDLTKALLQFKREGEDAIDVIDNYFRENEFDMNRHDQMIEFIKTSEHLSMSDISVTVNHLLLI
jgi:glutamate dehydrogenase